MKKLILSVVVLLLAGYTLSAQKVSYGLMTAVNFSTLTLQTRNDLTTSGDHYEVKNGILTGFDGGAFLNIKISKHFSIQPEVHFSMAGNKTFAKTDASASGGNINETNGKQRLNYITIPILLQYQLPKNFFVETGIQTDFLVSAKHSFSVTTNGHDAGSDEYENARSYQKHGFNINFGAGYQFAKLPVGVFARYSLGLADLRLVTDYGTTTKNRTMQLGAFLKLPNKK